MYTAPRAMSGRGGGAGTGTAVVAGLVRLLKARKENDARSKSVGVETKKTRKGIGTKRAPKYHHITRSLTPHMGYTQLQLADA